MKFNYLIDIDGTICEDIPNEESHRFGDAKVYDGAVTWVNGLYEAGHHITFFTARTNEHLNVTTKWLKKHNFKFHHIITDKPRGGNYHWVDNLEVTGHLFKGNYEELKQGVIMRSPSYRPYIWDDKLVIYCPCEVQGGPCWGPTTVVDEVHTESQYLEICACQGHAEVILTGDASFYKHEEVPDKHEVPEEIIQMEKEVAQTAKWFGMTSPLLLIFSIICFLIELYLLSFAFLYAAHLFVLVWILTKGKNK